MHWAKEAKMNKWQSTQNANVNKMKRGAGLALLRQHWKRPDNNKSIVPILKATSVAFFFL